MAAPFYATRTGAVVVPGPLPRTLVLSLHVRFLADPVSYTPESRRSAEGQSLSAVDPIPPFNGPPLEENYV
jgi:hypothetical protein